MALAALLVAIAALLILAVSFGLLFFIALPLAVLAVVLGAVARGQGRGRHGVATAGLATGIVGIVLSFAGAVYTALLLAGYWED